jgi:hypothetical protein
LEPVFFGTVLVEQVIVSPDDIEIGALGIAVDGRKSRPADR